MASQSSPAFKAVLLLLLLSGSEASRVKNEIKFADQFRAMWDMHPETAEAEWRTSNRQCSWSHYYRKCIDTGGLEDKCAYKALNKDVTYSESCRLSDQWMLANDARKWAQIRAGVLERKAEKYKRDCTGAFGFMHPVCWRRSKHMSRSVSFLTEALDPKYNLTQEDKDGISKSLKKVTWAITSDSPNSERIAKLTEAAKAKVQECKDVQSALTVLRKTARTLSKMLLGDPNAQKEAEDFVDRIDTDNGEAADELTKQTKEELLEDVGVNVTGNGSTPIIMDDMNFEDLHAAGRGMQGHLDQMQDELDAADVDGETETNSSLVQLGAFNGVQTTGPMAWVVAAATVITSVCLFIFTSVPASLGLMTAVSFAAGGMAISGPWIFLGLLAYGAIALLGCALVSGITSMFKSSWINVNFGKCFLKTLALPFMLVGNLLECLAWMLHTAVSKGRPSKAFKCMPLPIFSGFWSPSLGSAASR